MRSGDEIAVRLLTPEEAPLLTALIRRCYGETYLDRSFYDEGAVVELLASARLHSIGAFSVAGLLVGHMGITMRAHGGITADAGMTLVHPDFRGRGIARRVAIGLAQQSIELGLVGVHDYPVTVHAATQRIGAGFGVDTGLLLANVPGDVVFEQMQTVTTEFRTNSLIRWLPFGPAPSRRVYLPDRYQEQIQALYTQAHLDRAVSLSREHLGEHGSELESRYDARRQTLRVTVKRACRDLCGKLQREMRIAESGGGLLVHVDLGLCDPTTPRAAEALRDLDFSFAGLLPEYHDGDVLRMQWLAKSVSTVVRSVVSSDSTQAIVAFVLGDRQPRTG